MQHDEKLGNGPRKLEAHDWASLVARIVSDVARIIQTEIRLFQASLNSAYCSPVPMPRFVEQTRCCCKSMWTH